MKITSIITPLAKLAPLVRPANDKPLHAGEIYSLWEGLTAGNEMMTVAETYLMDTEDSEIQVLLEGLIKQVQMNRINPLEKILKKEGFIVPPRPPSKSKQGMPGAGQEIKLLDEEVIKNLTAWAQIGLYQNARSIGACTRESLRKVFIDLLFDEMMGYDAIFTVGNSRQVYNPPPPATAGENSLSMEEVSRLWEELNARHLSVINLEFFIGGTKDSELLKLLYSALHENAEPQLEQLENALKKEGFTVPPRPADRTNQGPPGQVNKIHLSDNEVIQVLTTAAQVAITHHVRGYAASVREDIRELFKSFTSTEIEEYQKLIQLAVRHHNLDNPPAVTSRRG